MQFKYAEIGDIVYFWFAANDITGTAADGATPLYDVRLAGAASTAAPTAEGTPTLLTHANYSNGVHEIAINTAAWAAGEYAVFCTLTVSTVNPSGFCGSFSLRTAGTAAIKTNLYAIKDQTITCGAGVTVNPNLGTTQPVNFTGTGASADVKATLDGETVTLAAATHTGAVVPTVTSLTNAPPDSSGTTTLLGRVVGTLATGTHQPQSGDSYALANGANGFAAIKGDTAAILVDTAEIGAAGAGLTALGDTRIANLDATVSSRSAPGTAQTITPPADMALNSTVAKEATLSVVGGYIDTEIQAIIDELAKVPKSDGTVTHNTTAITAIQTGLALASVCTAARLQELDVGTPGRLAYYVKKMMTDLVNKKQITEATGNTEQFDDDGNSLGTITAAYSSAAGVKIRKRMVI